MANITSSGDIVGTDARDLIIGTGSGQTIRAGGGRDAVIAGHGPVILDDLSSNGTRPGALNIDNAAWWSTGRNPMVGDASVPYATILGLGQGQNDWFAVTIGAGQTVTVDFDSVFPDIYNRYYDFYPDWISKIQITDAGGNVVATGSSSVAAAGGLGSVPYIIFEAELGTESFDAYLTYTATTAGTYYVNLGAEAFGSLAPGPIPANSSYLLNVSITGHAATGVEPTAGADLIDGGAGADYMIGGPGDDIYLVDDENDQIVEFAGDGWDEVRVTQAGISGYRLSPNVEALTAQAGQYIARLRGNDLDNVITGNEAGDNIDGGAGADRMIGLLGDDTYHVDQAGDAVVELPDGGSDTIFSSISFDLAGTNVENLSLLVSGGGLASGNDLANRLSGSYDGADILDGKAGADEMYGYFGNDIYYVDNAGDLVSDVRDGGQDEVRASLNTYVLPAYIELLTGLSNAGQGLTGNALDNVVVGGAGADRIVGSAGDDRMVGGAGDDQYSVSQAGDVVVELAGAGDDLIFSAISYDITGTDVETLGLTGTANIDAIGNDRANALWGNAGANLLDGRGGADIMIGWGGDDIYLVDDAGDAVIEYRNMGRDEVRTALAVYTLPDNVEALTGLSDSGQLLTANALDNVIVGGAGADRIVGAAGADRMVGGAGDDQYSVSQVGDVVVELAQKGTDLIFSSISYDIRGTHVENLVLTGTANSAGIGNSLANALTGNVGDNRLSGGAGQDSLYGRLGADVLTGGGDADRFVFDTTPGGGNVDRITDFANGSDVIMLAHPVFTAAGHAGELTAGAFVIGTAAGDAEDRIIHDSATGSIFYDADGNGAGAAVLFAQVSAGLALINADFLIV